MISGSKRDPVSFLVLSGQFVSGIQAVSLPGQEWRGSRKPNTEGGWVSSRFWLYKRMINDNSIRNKTKHLSCCQSSETSKHQDVGTGQCGRFPEKHTTIKLLLLWINRSICLPWVPAEKGRGERGNNFSSVSEEHQLLHRALNSTDRVRTALDASAEDL